MTPFYISAVLALLLAGFVLTLKHRRAGHALFAGALMVLAALNLLTAVFGVASSQAVSVLKILLAGVLPVLLFLHVRTLLLRQGPSGLAGGIHALAPVGLLILTQGPGLSLQPYRDFLLFGLWSLYALLAFRELLRARRLTESGAKPAMQLWTGLLCIWMLGVAAIDLILALQVVRPAGPEFRMLFLAAGSLLLATVGAVLFATLHRAALLAWLTDRPPVRVARPALLIDRLEADLRQSRAFLDPNLTLARFSRQSCQPQRVVADEINEARGRSFRNWLNGFRIEEAKRLLLEEPERSVTEVFLESGFQTKSTFNAAFKAETGLSPSVWRAGGSQ